MDKEDKVYAQPISDVSAFDFNDHVAAVFPDMIKRSVPGYDSIIKHLGTFSKLFVTDDSNVYDLGSSLGAASMSIRRSIIAKNVEIIAVDNSASMVKRSKSIFDAYSSEIPITVLEDNITNVSINNASMVVLNFTLQFIEKQLRTELLAKIHNGLNPGGLLVLSEKVHFNNPVTQKMVDDLHLDFKRENGYSELEISQKREALQDILIPETIEEHRERLLSVGFRSADVWFQQYNFASIVAIK